MKHELTPVDEALAIILQKASPVSATETILLEKAVKRVLAVAPTSLVSVPPADNSSMDGYAVNSHDCQGVQVCLPVSQRIAAGQAPQPLAAGTAARIFTGAEMPTGADAVVIQEQVRITGDQITFQGPVSAGKHVRPEGQDIAADQVVMAKGQRLQPADLGLLAAAGLERVCVYRPIKVAILSTGNELVEPGKPLAPGQIYDANRFVLSALLTQLGCEVVNMGCIPDEGDAINRALQQAAQQADCIVSTGGVSVGEEDYVKQAVEQLGELALWRMRIKPGKPLAFGQVQSIPFFGLPGNPASSLITFALFVRPFLLKQQGVTAVAPLRLPLAAGFTRTQSGTREEYMRARYENGEVIIHPNQSSGMLSSAHWANGLVVIYPDQTVATGTLVEFIPFSELLN